MKKISQVAIPLNEQLSRTTRPESKEVNYA